MIKNVTMKEVLKHDEDYYIEEYRRTWIKDLELLHKITESCNKNEMQRLYDMINGETYEFMDMIQYLMNNKN